MNRNFVKDGEAVDASVRALFSEVSMQLSNELYYKEHGFSEYEPEIPEDKLSSVSGFGKGTLTVAGKQYGSNQRYKGYATSLVLRKYTSLIDYSEEDIHWLTKAPTAKRVMEFRSSVEGAVNALNANVNEDCAKTDYLGFGTTFLAPGDSVPIYDQAHPIRKSGTTAHPNTFYTGFGASTTNLAFDKNALVEAIQRMDRFLLNDATQMRKTRKLRILCSTEKAETVAQTLYSMYGPTNAELGRQIGSKDFQSILGRTIDYAVIPDIPYAYRNYWFVIDMERARKMRWLAWGWKPRLNEEREYQKGLSYNAGSVLFGPLISDWRYGFASKGDASVVS
ncbi:MAG: hypothetical protein WC917_00760 [Bacilli bacterium]|jgi:hypothetical protein